MLLNLILISWLNVESFDRPCCIGCKNHVGVFFISRRVYDSLLQHRVAERYIRRAVAELRFTGRVETPGMKNQAVEDWLTGREETAY